MFSASNERLSQQPGQVLSRRGALASGVGAGLTTLVLPSVAAATSVGGAGGGAPTYANATTFTSEPGTKGNPVGGVWATGGANWRFNIKTQYWTYPLLDSGKTDPATFVYEYQISPNNQANWFTMSLIPPDILSPELGTKLFGAWVSFSIIPEHYPGESVPANGLDWYVDADEWWWVRNAYIRVLDNGTVIDISPAFWLW